MGASLSEMMDERVERLRWERDEVVLLRDEALRRFIEADRMRDEAERTREQVMRRLIKTEQAKDDAQTRLDALVQGIAQVRGSKDGTDKERLVQRRSKFLTSMGLMS